MKKVSWSLVFSSIVFFASILLMALPTVRESFSQFFFSRERKVLSVVEADIFRLGSVYRVLKISDADGIAVEIHGPPNENESTLWGRINLPDRKNGYTHVFGQATSLALRDLDGDGMAEILAPTYDQNMNPHLNAIKIDRENKRLEGYTGKAP